MSYSLESIDVQNNPVVIWSFNTKKYTAFKTLDDVIIEDEYCCEVILKRHRFYIDIDIDMNNNPDIDEMRCITLINDIVISIEEITGLEDCEYAVYRTDYSHKFSYHIIFLNIVCNSYRDSNNLYTELFNKMTNDDKKFIDKLYKRVQNFRLPNARKGVSKPPKLLDDELSCIYSQVSDKQYEHWVTYINENLNNYVYSTYTKRNEMLEMEELAVDQTITEEDRVNIKRLNADNNFEFWKLAKTVMNDINMTYYYFKRINSSYCEVCKRTHDAENSLMGMESRYNKSVVLYEYCRRNINSNEINERILRYSSKPYINKKRDEAESMISYTNKSVNFDKPELFYTDSISRDEFTLDKYLDESVFTEQDKQTLFYFRAPMKFGKTKALRDFIDKFEHNTISILVISFRLLFTKEFISKFSDFTSYTDISGKIDLNIHRKVVVQLDSLHRVLLHAMPDMIIMDESESIIQHFSSDTLKDNVTTIFNAFRMMLNYSKLAIAIDANLSNRTIKTLRACAPTHKEIMYYNTNKMSDDSYTYTIYSHKVTWFQTFISMLTQNKRIIVPTSSLRMAYIIKHVAVYCISNLEDIKKELESETIDTSVDMNTYLRYISDKLDAYENMSHEDIMSESFDHNKVMVYSSETSIRVKGSHLSDINNIWAKYDVIIYTPSITSGVSYEGDIPFDCVFGIFNNTSCDIYSMIQMLGRARATTEFHLYLDDSAEKHIDIHRYDPDQIFNLTGEVISLVCFHYDVFELQLISDHIEVEQVFKDGVLKTFVHSLSKDELVSRHPYYIMAYHNYHMLMKTQEFFVPSFINALTDSTTDIKNIKYNTNKHLDEKIMHQLSANTINVDLIEKFTLIVNSKKHITLQHGINLAGFTEIDNIKLSLLNPFKTLWYNAAVGKVELPNGIYQLNAWLSLNRIRSDSYVPEYTITDSAFILKGLKYSIEQIIKTYNNTEVDYDISGELYRIICQANIIQKIKQYNVDIDNNALNEFNNSELVALYVVIAYNENLYNSFSDFIKQVDIIYNTRAVIMILLSFALKNKDEIIDIYKNRIAGKSPKVISTISKNLLTVCNLHDINKQIITESSFSNVVYKSLDNVRLMLCRFSFNHNSTYSIIPTNLLENLYEEYKTTFVYFKIPVDKKIITTCYKAFNRLFVQIYGISIKSVYQVVLDGFVQHLVEFNRIAPFVSCIVTPDGLTLGNFTKTDSYITKKHHDEILLSCTNIQNIYTNDQSL